MGYDIACTFGLWWAAIAIDAGGKKHTVRLGDGAIDSAAALADLIERGLPTKRSVLFVIDGTKVFAQVGHTFGQRGNPTAVVSTKSATLPTQYPRECASRCGNR